MTETPSLFSERELSTLAALCDTLIPALNVQDDPHGFYQRAASDLAMAPRLADLLPQVTEPGLVRQLRWFLRAIEIPLVNLLLSGQDKAFGAMSLEERTALLVSWETSKLNLQRKTFQSLKRLTLMLFYSLTENQTPNPNWAAIGYSGPLPQDPKPVSNPIRPLEITEDTILYTDVVVIGSGAGGGVVAGELSAAGLDVVVLEKGGYYAEADFTGDELSSTERMFENKGVLTTSDLSLAILAGSTLGGGTTINWAGSLRTPDYVLREWEAEYGVTSLGDYEVAMDAVSARIHVNTDHSQANPQNAALEAGAQGLGLSCKVFPRNVQNCDDCGFCNFGCQHGAKQSTLRTYLQDAFERGTRVVVRATVERVLIEYGQAVGVLATVVDSEGRPHTLTVKADKVVVAAGSLHTPVVLMRSGLANHHIGRNLHLHPTTVIYGIYNEAVRGWSGPMMSRYVDSFKNLDGQGYGVTLETAPIHPGIGALTLSWASGLQHKQVMAQLDHLANIIIITRDQSSGQITLNRRQQPVIHYTLTNDDTRHMMRGLIEALRIQAAAGARQIGAPFALPLVWRDGEPWESYLDKVSRQSLTPNSFALFSAHQMSSCRMAGSSARGAVDPSGETFEVKNLYVADASILPTASGVNPMLTIMAMAHRVAGHIQARS